MKRILRVRCFIFVLAVPLVSWTQATAPEEKVPVIKGEAGPCSLELTIIGGDGKPVYAATVKVHIPYGFGGMHKLDLEAGTNSDGKVKFAGLPSRVRRPPLEFLATKDEWKGMATYDPAIECETKKVVKLEKLKAPDVH
jgi:hypothetical protein